MNVEYSNNKYYKFAYCFSNNEKNLIATVLPILIKRLKKKQDKLEYNYEGQADIAMEIDDIARDIKTFKKLLDDWKA